MEQVYNYTQDDPSSHASGLKNYAYEIQSKADQLNTTSDDQSSSELTTIRNNDIQGTKLATKATELKEKAESLHSVAQSLRAEAANPSGSTLATLHALARQLKEKAKQDSGGESLFKAAKQLASHSDGSIGLEQKATNVIDKFEAVAGAYNALMEEAKTIKQQGHEKVANVEKEYTQLKAIYDEMFNLTKLLKVAKDLTSTLPAATTLESNVKALRDHDDADQDYTKAQQVIQQFETVENEFNALPEEQKPDVQEKFEALKTLYDSILKFTKIKHYSTELSTAAEQLPGGSGDPKKVIINFNTIVNAYNALGADQSMVKPQFNELETEYSKAIYYYKWHFITLLSS